MLIRADVADVVVVGGADRSSTSTTCAPGTCSGSCRPTSAGRSRPAARGLVLGEGAGMLVLEREAHAQGRAARLVRGAISAAHRAATPATCSPPIRPAWRRRSARARRCPSRSCRCRLRQCPRHGHGCQRRRRSGGAEGRARPGSRRPRRSPRPSRRSATPMGASGALEAIVTLAALQQPDRATDARLSRRRSRDRLRTDAERAAPARDGDRAVRTHSPSAASTCRWRSGAERRRRPLSRAGKPTLSGPEGRISDKRNMVASD